MIPQSATDDKKTPHTKNMQDTTSDQGSDKNVMPSMIVRQQRLQRNNLSTTNHLITTTGAGDDFNAIASAAAVAAAATTTASNGDQLFDRNGLVIPKRVSHQHPSNSAQPMIRDLNRELKFKQARGNQILEQKSELKKAMEKLEQSKRRKEAEQDRLSRRTSLELRLEERAQRLANKDQSREQSDEHPTSVVSATANALNSLFPQIKSVTR